MRDNWFYIRQWQKRKFNSIGLELNQDDANFLFKSVSGYDDKIFVALVNKEDKWKVVASEDDIKDWDIVKSSLEDKVK